MNTVNNGGVEAKAREVIVEWLKSLLPGLSLSKTSDEDLRACLLDATVFCRILDRLKPGFVGDSVYSSESRYDKIRRVMAALDEMGLPKFEIYDLEKGSMKTVYDSLLALRAQSVPIVGGKNFPITDPLARTSSEERRKALNDSKFQRALRSPVASEPSAALIHHVGHKFHEVFQLKQGRYADLPAAKISEMEKSNSLDNAPTQSLLSVVNGILDESIERKNGEIPQRFACLLRKVVLEIERRISTQAEHLRTQNNVFKAREEKYQSRIRVLEALATGTCDETQIVMNQLQRLKSDKTKMEEKKKLEEQDMVRLSKEKDRHNLEISSLKQEMEIARKTHELSCKQIETEAKEVKVELEVKLKELESLLNNSKNKVKELEAKSEAKHQTWNKTEHSYKKLIDFQFGALKELRCASQSIKQDLFQTENSYLEDFKSLDVKLKVLSDAAENYHSLLAENRKLFNEVQDLKGNIRVYCRIRPFLRGQNGKLTTIESIGEDGELVIANPSKTGKDALRLFKFNEVYGPAATQEKVYSDTQPLIRSVLDGFNVCIFAYGQTGSGKTYTMIGPNGASEEDWGVNYRALNDLFKISQARRSSFMYEIGVQMIEIYNEQVRDLLSSDGTQKKLGILTTSQPNGLTVPDASMLPVKSTSDVLDLMGTGLRNRAVGATAMNERSSRSHSVVTIHVRGTDLKTDASLRGSLHLVDLAGSERVDRSEVTGDRLKEAQFINKSLSALGDVIFALAQKSPHVPYRNSKLTQVLQSSLGGQAKTLMFVQLNPDINSYSETMSTLKFAERVSGVELGAARSTKEGKDVKELMEQVVSLKDTISKKDEEIERLQLLKDLKNVYPSINGEKRGTASSRYGSPSPSRQENEILRKSKLVGGQNSPDVAEILASGVVADYEDRLSDKSDGALSIGTETDGSVDSYQEGVFLSDNPEKAQPSPKIPRPSKETLRVSRSLGKTASSNSLAKSAKRWA